MHTEGGSQWHRPLEVFLTFSSRLTFSNQIIDSSLKKEEEVRNMTKHNKT
jgi:hypothetical protein